MQVIKKNKNREDWNDEKIVKAILKSADHSSLEITKNQATQVAEYCKKQIQGSVVETSKLHGIVIDALRTLGYSEIANSYRNYRNFKETDYETWREMYEQAEHIIYRGDNENANFDSSLISTKGSLIKGNATKRIYQDFILNKNEKFLTRRGDIYIHDMRDMIFGSVNCSLFDIANVLKNGFTMSNIKYSEPNSVLSALQVIGDITLVATAQQFGGFTLPEIDKVLLPYVKKSFNKYMDMYTHRKISKLDAEKYATEDTLKELQQGFQGLELKLNTVPCSRGDFAFTTLTFGQWDVNLAENDKYWLKEISKTILDIRRIGHNGVSVVFPKLVYLYDENQINNDHYSSELFDIAVKTSAKCMYPDYLSLSGDIEHNKVAQEYSEHGTIISPMGCRAYLSHWEDPNTGKAVTVGRCNIGAVSLNIPVIMAVAKQEYGSEWKSKFWALLESRLQTIREFLCKRYELISHVKASTNPLAFTQGGFYNGYRKPDEEVGNLIDYMTASFGITALNESTILWNGKTLYEDKAQFANKVIDFIDDKVQKFKKEDHHLYALYGTPKHCGH